MNEDIIDLARRYVLELFSNKLSDNFCFHNIKHTQDVVQATLEIAQECHLNPKQFEIVTLAAWFHDCGYTCSYNSHEDNSKTIAKDFLNLHKYPKERLDQILACIEATRFPQNPTSLEEQVLADADLYHFSRPDYPRYEQKLRKEIKLFLGKSCTDFQWAKTNYTLLKNHKYFTDYGKNVLQQFKQVNIERINTKLMFEKE